MKKLTWLLLAWVCLYAPPVFAQGGVDLTGTVQNSRGIPVAGARITVCAEAATGNPCSPGGTLYSDPLLTTPISTVDHAFTDGLGNYHFFVPFGTYRVSISGNGIATTTITRVLSGGGGGGGGGTGTTTCMMTFGADGGPALTDADLNQKAICEVPFVPTITTVIVMADAGATRFQLDYRHNNTAFGITSPALIPATVVGIGDKVACANTGGTVIVIQGVNVTCTSLLATTTFAGDWLESDPSGTPADGVTKRISVAVLMTGNGGGGGGGGGGSVTSIGTTAPLTGGLITTTGAVACPTCTTSSAALTNNQIVSGAGGQGTKSNNLSGDVTTTGTMVTTIGAGTVTEAKQSLSDNTTQNVTTARHGYVPKLPGDSTLFLSGAGTFLPGGGGGSGVSLRTNSVVNPTQTILNLTQGSGVALTDNGSGQITVAATALASTANVRYAAPWGNDTTGNGLSPATPYLSVYKALCSLPSGNCAAQVAGTGVVYAYNGADATPVPNTGLWLMGPFDSQYASPPPGWLKRTLPLSIIGLGGTGNPQGQAPMAFLNSGFAETGLWLSASDVSILIDNLGFYGQYNAIRVGIDSAGRPGVNEVTSYMIRNFFAGGLPYGRGPAIDIGQESFFANFVNGLVSANPTPPENQTEAEQDVHQAIVANPGGGASNGLTFEHLNIQGGGIKIYNGGTSGGAILKNIFLESRAAAAIWVDHIGNSDAYAVDGVYVSDCDTVSCLALRVDSGVSSAMTATNISGYISGPMTITGGSLLYPAGATNLTPYTSGQRGISGGRVWAQDNDSRRQFSPISVRFPNQLFNSTTDPNFNHTICSTGTNTITTGITAPDGSTNAFKLHTTDSPGCAELFYNTHTFAVGDWLFAGVWERADGNAGPPIGMGVAFRAGGIEESCFPKDVPGPPGGDGEWIWYSFACKITNVGDGSGDPYVVVQSYQDIDYFGGVVNWVPAGTLTDVEATEYLASLQSYSQTCSVGQLCTVNGNFGDITVTSCTGCVPSYSVSDDFNRANAGTLGANWTTPTGSASIGIASNGAQPTATSGNLEFYSATIPPADQCSTAIIRTDGSASDYMGVGTRISATGNGYTFLVSGPSGVSSHGYLQQIFGGTALTTYTLGSQDTVMTITNGDEIKLCSQGSTHTAYLNNVAKIRATDTTYVTGRPGLFYFNTTGAFTNTVFESWSGASTITFGDVTITETATTNNLVATGAVNFSGATSITLPFSAGLATTANGQFGYDTTGLNWQAWQNGANHIVGVFDATSTVNGNCVQIVKSGSTVNLQDAGAACGGGGGGGGSFSTVTNGTNTTAAMVVGSGASIAVSGTGAVTATALASGSITSAQLGTALTDETGSGLAVFGTSPTIVTPTIASFTNATHNHTNAAGGGQITDAALSAAVGAAKGGTGVSSSASTGVPHVTAGTWTFDAGISHLASSTSAQLATVLSDETGSGLAVFGTSPTIVTPTIASFTNATHNHTNAAGGGQITDSALSAPVGFAKGGTGLSTAADDTVLISSGSAYVATAIPGCLDTGSNHLNYNASTNTILCGTAGGSGTITGSGTPSSGQAAEFTSGSAITGVATAGGGTSYIKGTITSAAAGDFLCYNSTPIVANCKAGTVTNAQTGTTYTVLTGDRSKYISYSNASAVAVTLPQAGSAGFTLNFTHVAANLGAGAVTYTPTTSTINGSATLVISQGQTCAIYSDNTNYFARCNSGQISAGSGLSSTPSATGTTLSLAGPVSIANGGTNTTSITPTALTDGATITWDAASASMSNRTLLFTTHGGSRTLNMQNMVAGAFYTLWLTQDGTGGEGLTLGTGCTWKVLGGGAGAITPSTGANKLDLLTFSYNGSICVVNFNKDAT